MLSKTQRNTKTEDEKDKRRKKVQDRQENLPIENNKNYVST